MITPNFAELVHMSPEERAKYNISIDSYRSNLSAWRYEREEGVAEGIAKGMAEGIAKGMAKGMAQGRAEGISETARNLKKMGVLTAEDIAKATGLTVDDINNL